MATNKAIIIKANADIILIVLGLLFNQTEILSAVMPYIIRVIKSNKILDSHKMRSCMAKLLKLKL